MLKAVNDLDPIRPNNSKSRGLSGCVRLLDWFTFHHHLCLVFNYLGMSLHDFYKLNSCRPFPRKHVQDITRQLLSSVAFLHKHGIAHADLKDDNVLLVDHKYGVYEVPRSKTGKRRKPWLILQKTEIRIIDFGLALFTEDRKHKRMAMIPAFRAPEVHLGIGWGRGADVFAVAVIAAELRFALDLFAGEDSLQCLGLMQAFIGPMPDELARRGVKVHPKWFRKVIKDKRAVTVLDWEAAFTKTKEKDAAWAIEYAQKPKKMLLKDNADNQFLALLAKMLAYDPKTRISATQALRHEYFTIQIPLKVYPEL